MSAAEERSRLTRPGRELARAERRLGDRLAQQRVARDVEDVAALEPGRVDLLGRELGRDAAVGGHRPSPARARRARRRRPCARRRPGRAPRRRVPRRRRATSAAAGVVAELAEDARLRAERHRPGGDVRRLAAGAGARASVGTSPSATSGDSSRTITSRSRSPSVQISIRASSQAREYTRGMDGQGRRDKLRSFALGGLVGASAVIAAARRRRRAGDEADDPGRARRVRGGAVLPRARRPRGTRRRRVAELSQRDERRVEVHVGGAEVERPAELHHRAGLLEEAERRAASARGCGSRGTARTRGPRTCRRGSAGEAGSSCGGRRCSCRSRRAPRRRARAAAASSAARRARGRVGARDDRARDGTAALPRAEVERVVAEQHVACAAALRRARTTRRAGRRRARSARP